ncbi:MAG: hypothetical protein P9L94_00080 [Candidatus Hinthialibacter antarcticus]|nr:hypothetical protein [Candidatus Hinthialibacter antarcticus]
MNIIQEWPDDPHSLLLNEDGPKIYYYIEVSANSCTNFLNSIKKKGEVDEAFIDRWMDRVKANHRIAGELRFRLKTADNRIQQRKKSNFSYRRLLTALRTQGIEDNNSLIFQLLERADSDDFPADIVAFAQDLFPDLRDSMTGRIEILGCWEVILDAARKVLVERLVILSHKLTEVAIQLQEDESIEKVRALLSEFQVMMPRTVDLGELPTDPMELKAILDEGIAELDTIRVNLHALNEHQDTLEKVKTQLDDQLSTAENSGSDDTTVVRRRDGGTGPGPSRMVFNKKKF